MRTWTLMKAAIRSTHRALVRWSPELASAYLGIIGLISRHFLRRSTAARIINIVQSTHWPGVSLPPQSVVVGENTIITLVPHIEEFDCEANFSRRLSYEAGVVQWVEKMVPNTYDLIIEIGANVGVFTALFERITRSSTRQCRILAFEPSRVAYSRLRENLELNGADRVETFCCAVGVRNGFISFFEPEGHLTNGSIKREFSSIFADELSEATAIVVSAGELGVLVEGHSKVLIKIDVEGYEAELLPALAPLLVRSNVDLIIEVLFAEVADTISAIPALNNHEAYLLSADGPTRHGQAFASPEHRDWLLKAPRRPASEPVDSQSLHNEPLGRGLN